MPNHPPTRRFQPYRSAKRKGPPPRWPASHLSLAAFRGARHRTDRLREKNSATYHLVGDQFQDLSSVAVRKEVSPVLQGGACSTLLQQTIKARVTKLSLQAFAVGIDEDA